MTLIVQNIIFDNTTDAAFRQWGSDLHSVISSVLTYVPQTGDANFATVTKPTGGNQNTWFKCYKWNDGLSELYLRISGGSGNDGATQVEILAQLCWGLDGSGNVVGTQYTGKTGPRAIELATSREVRISRVDGAFVINIDDNWIICADRSRNPVTGAADAKGATLVIGSAAASVQNSLYGFQGRGIVEYTHRLDSDGGRGAMGTGTRTMSPMPTFYTTFGSAKDASVLGITPYAAGMKPSPIAVVLGQDTDFRQRGTTASFKNYATMRTYRATAIYGDNANITRYMVIEA